MRYGDGEDHGAYGDDDQGNGAGSGRHDVYDDYEDYDAHADHEDHGAYEDHGTYERRGHRDGGHERVRRASQEGPRAPDGGRGIPDGVLVGFLVFLLGMTLLMWTATGLAGLLDHGSWPSGVIFSRTPLAMRHLIASPHDVPGAWPHTPEDQLSGYGLLWGLFIGQLMVLFVLLLFTLSTVARWRTRRAAQRTGRGRVKGGAPVGRGPRPSQRPSPRPSPSGSTSTGPRTRPLPSARGAGHRGARPRSGTGRGVGTGAGAVAASGPGVTGAGMTLAKGLGGATGVGAGTVTGAAGTGAAGTGATGGTGAATGAAAPSAGDPASPGPSAGPAPGQPGRPGTPPAGPKPTAVSTPPALANAATAASAGSTPEDMSGSPSDVASHAAALAHGARPVVLGPADIRRPAAVAAVQDSEGPALVVTSDPALWTQTKDARAKLGPVLLYDPAHLCETPARLHWSPITGCEDRGTAAERSRALLAPVRPTAKIDTAVADTAETLLRSFLHAAAVDGRQFRHVHRWAQGKQIQDAVRILRSHPKAVSGAGGELEAALTAHPQRRDIAQELTARALSALSSVHIRDSCTPNRTDALSLDSFVAEGGTLYLVGEAIEDPKSHPGAMPLLTALASSVVEHGRRMAARSSAGRLDPPLALVLDDVAAVAPFPQLPRLLTTGAGQGIPALVLLRSREQARARWPHDDLPF